MSHFASGREAAIARRRALAAGKTALPPPAERTRAGFREARLAGAEQSAPPPALPAPAAPALSGRLASLARRRSLAAGKAGAQAIEPAAPPMGQGPGERRSRLTASRVADGHRVTGGAPGAALPVSGTQHIVTATGSAPAVAPKVGHACTDGGLVVSGTLVRSAVRITGDERGDRHRITGEADPLPADDLTARPSQNAAALAQYRRQFDTQAAFAGRAPRHAGSRQRNAAPVLEVTEAGAVITGSAVGRSLRVTGDEAGACRPVSGSQYLTPARRETACGGSGGGTASAAEIGAERADPVTVTKVSTSSTWGGRRVTGADVQRNTHVTGDPPGGGDLMTGSQYDPPQANARSAAARRMQAHARLPVTGDAPVASGAVSGLERGAGRDITGTPYAVQAIDPGATPPAGFSVPSPQRARSRGAEEAAPITGSFAVGGGKVTGNVEFRPLPRPQGRGEAKPAHARLTGEGAASGARITGDSWAETSRVTGTEGAFAAGRNPTERGEQAKSFAGSATFKAKARHEEAKQLVTGMVGYFNKAGARVTLSGGAQS